MALCRCRLEVLRKFVSIAALNSSPITLRPILRTSTDRRAFRTSVSHATLQEGPQGGEHRDHNTFISTDQVTESLNFEGPRRDTASRGVKVPRSHTGRNEGLNSPRTAPRPRDFPRSASVAGGDRGSSTSWSRRGRRRGDPESDDGDDSSLKTTARILKKLGSKETSSHNTSDTETPRSQKEDWKIQKAALEEKFGGASWQPRKRLSPDALEGIRALHAEHPQQYTTQVLANEFKISPEAIRRILKSKWRPSDDEQKDRQDRWLKRGEKIWTQMVELGVKPPKKWREMGIGRKARSQDSRERVDEEKPDHLIARQPRTQGRIMADRIL